MTMKLPQKAGFVATTAEWDQLVRIAENLAAQLAQARAERAELIETVARLRAALAEADKSAQVMADEFYEVSEDAYLIDPVIFDAHRQAVRSALRHPASAQDDQLDGESVWLLNETIAALSQPAPAQPDATMLSDNSLQTSSQAPAQGQE